MHHISLNCTFAIKDMLNRRLHRVIISGITGIVLFSVIGAWLLISLTSLFFAFVCICIIIALAIMLVRKMEKTDRQLESFFSAINNNDFNAHFTEKGDDKFLNGLFREMNRIITQFISGNEPNHSSIRKQSYRTGRTPFLLREYHPGIDT